MTHTDKKYFSQTPVHISRAGRPKGAKNIVGQSVRWNLLEAYRRNGGLEWLTSWGQANPDLFFPLLSKLLPHELAESGYGQALTVIVQRAGSPEHPKVLKSLPTEEDPQPSTAGGGTD